jgi:hypothetical protein
MTYDFLPFYGTFAKSVGSSFESVQIEWITFTSKQSSLHIRAQLSSLPIHTTIFPHAAYISSRILTPHS